MKIQSRYSANPRVRKSFDPKKGRVKSEFARDADINQIVGKYLRTGQLPTLAKSNPQYGDFSDVPSYQESLNRVMVAEAQFMALPAAVRRECDNDPTVFLDKVQDPDWALKHKLALPVGADGAPFKGRQEADKAAATQPEGARPAKKEKTPPKADTAASDD